MKTFSRLVTVALCLGCGLAWSPRAAFPARPMARRPSEMPRMANNQGEPEDGTVVNLSMLEREQIVYNAAEGRFYESKIEGREEFCAVDKKTGKPIVLSVAEKERIFVDALQAYFFDGREVLNDKDFDQLKEDLLWEGSPVAALSRDENQYLIAMQAFLKGAPVMPDDEFDALKTKLKAQKSSIAVTKEPRCFVDTGICSVTWSQDKVRQYVAYLPTAVVVTLLWVIFAFELTPLRYVNPLVGVILGSPVIWYGSIFFAENVFFNNPLVASGACPTCNADNVVLFGDVLGVSGFGDNA